MQDDPLTLTLSPLAATARQRGESDGEREQQDGRYRISRHARFAVSLMTILPLPFGRGEGRGEGKFQTHDYDSVSVDAHGFNHIPHVTGGIPQRLQRL